MFLSCWSGVHIDIDELQMLFFFLKKHNDKTLLMTRRSRICKTNKEKRKKHKPKKDTKEEKIESIVKKKYKMKQQQEIQTYQ